MGRKWQEFVKQLDASADFFADNLASDQGIQPIKVLTDFRPNGPALDGTEQVYEWRMGSADSQAVRPHGDDQFLWRFGDPVEFSVTWADQSDYLPKNAEPGSMPLIGGPQNRSATYRVADPWALLTMIGRYEAGKSDSDACKPQSPTSGTSVVLCFPISAEGRNGADVTQVEVPFYVQIELFRWQDDPANGQALQIPSVFPVSPPQFQAGSGSL